MRADNTGRAEATAAARIIVDIKAALCKLRGSHPTHSSFPKVKRCGVRSGGPGRKRSGTRKGTEFQETGEPRDKGRREGKKRKTKRGWFVRGVRDEFCIEPRRRGWSGLRW